MNKQHIFDQALQHIFDQALQHLRTQGVPATLLTERSPLAEGPQMPQLTLPIEPGRAYKNRINKTVYTAPNTIRPLKWVRAWDSKEAAERNSPDSGEDYETLNISDGRYNDDGDISDFDLIEGPLAETPVEPPQTEAPQMTSKLTQPIEVGQTYVTRDGKTVVISRVDKDIDVAYYEYGHSEECAFAGYWDPAKPYIGMGYLNGTKSPYDLVKLVSKITPAPTVPTVPTGEALVSMINEALTRLDQGDEAMDEAALPLNHKSVVEYIILGKEIKWAPAKPAEFMFTEPVNFIPEKRYYWALLNMGGVWTPHPFINTVPSIGKDHCERYHVHFTAEAAQNHARILNEFGPK